MNYEIIDGPTLGEKLKNTVSAQTAEVKLAVAYIGQGAVDILGVNGLHKVKVICDFLSGGTNPQAVDALVDAGVEVKHLNGLHAKIGIIGNAFSFVGSSNLSKNGMADDTDFKRYERIVVIEGVERTILDDWGDMWKASSVISPQMKEIANAKWKLRQEHRALEAMCGAAQSLVEILKSSPEQLDALNVHMIVYEPLNEDEEAKFEAGEEALKAHNTEVVEAYWDWKELPTQGFLVDFDKPLNRKLSYNGLYYRDTSKFKDTDTPDGTFHAAVSVHSAHGIKCEKHDQSKIKKAFSRFRKDHPADAEGAWCFQISELSRYLE